MECDCKHCQVAYFDRIDLCAEGFYATPDVAESGIDRVATLQLVRLQSEAAIPTGTAAPPIWLKSVA